METWEERLAELEIRLAWQDELVQSLNDTVAKLNDRLDLQQAQLKLLYQRLNEKASAENAPFNPANEIPPHY